MKIVIVGSGYVGLVSGACFSEFGFNVICVDNDKNKIDNLNNGIIPIYEPGLESLIISNKKANRLSFSTSLKDAMQDVDVVMIAVGTPTRRGDGHADLTYTYEASKEIARFINKYTVIVTKSTVPVGTSKKIVQIIQDQRSDLKEGLDFDVASNPEFLREGSAINDFMRPDRVIIGVNNDKSKEVLEKLYRPLYLIETPILWTSPQTAELIKYASNGFLAMKISFINQMADICEKAGADVQVLAKGIGLDKRIGGKFLHAGPGYGGSCFPKDTRALSRIAKDLDVSCSLIDEVISYNEDRKLMMANRIINALEKSNLPKKVAILGLTFKPNTDDLRESPSLIIIPKLLQAGIDVSVYDPLYYKDCKRLPHAFAQEDSLKKVTFAQNAYEAVTDKSGVVILTEWNELRALDLKEILSLMKTNDNSKPLFMDFKNIYKVVDMEGFEYVGIGNP